MIKELSIPRRRIPVVIGGKGEIKRLIERETHTKLVVGEFITITGEIVDIMLAENIVRAIGRGFSPENALELLDEEKTLYIIQLPDNKTSLKRIKARVIGTGGKARRNIERLTHTKISVYGKTVSIIGGYSDVEKAKDALERLIAGARHGTIYKGIKRQ